MRLATEFRSWSTKGVVPVEAWAGALVCAVSIAVNVYLAGRLGACRRALVARTRERETEAFERVIAQERTRIARDIHDDLGAGLTQIALLSDTSVGAEIPRDEVMQGLVEIRARARESLLALNEIVWAVDPGSDSLPRLADYLCTLADACFRGSDVRCHKDVPMDLPDWPIRADVRHHIAMAVKEAMANVLRHSGAREASLALRWEPPLLRLDVLDDGGGFDPATVAKTGHGLENQRQRMLQIAGDMRIARRAGGGMHVTFTVPLAGADPGAAGA